jgi:hypothetical protein
MNIEDPMQQNIRRTTGLHALKKIRGIVDKENADDEFKARALRQLMRYGWIVLLLAAAMLARLTGVI